MSREGRNRSVRYRKLRYRRKVRMLRNAVVIGMILCVAFGAVKLVGARIPMLGMMTKNPSILFHEEEYPEELLDMLSRNPEMEEFVRNYPEKKGHVYADTIGEVTKGEYPLLLQWDERWGYGNYGDSSVAVSGCAPTSLAMVIAGLTGENTVTPYTIAKYAEENGYYVSGTGTSWEIFHQGCQAFGVAGETISLTKNTVMEALQAGKPIICSMRPGDFTTAGHFIVLAGTEDGRIRVLDPNSRENSEKLWEYERLEPQIKNLWAFQEI